MLIIAVDAGTLKSAAVLVDTETKLPIQAIFESNAVVKEWIMKTEAEEICIEILTSYGIAGETVFTTQLWNGMFWAYGELTGKKPSGIYRKIAVKHLCGNGNAGDAGVRKYLVARYGYFAGNKGLGTVAKPGPIQCLTNCHKQAAMCIAIAHIEGATHVNLKYSTSTEKKEKDKKKKIAAVKRRVKADAQGSDILRGRTKTFKRRKWK